MKWPEVPLGELLRQVNRSERVDASKEYRLLGVRLDGAGPFLRETKLGGQSAAASLSQTETGDFIYSRLFAWRGAFGVIQAELNGCYVSNEFPTFQTDASKLDAAFLNYWFKLRSTLNLVEEKCTGSTPLTRNRFKEAVFLPMRIPLPPLAEQRRLVARIQDASHQVNFMKTLQVQRPAASDAVLKARLNWLFGDCYQATPGSQRFDWTRLSDCVTDVADGPHVTPTYCEAGVPFITAQNITTGRVRFENHKFIMPDDHRLYQRRAVAEKGDVLITKDGTVGVPCFIDTDREFSFFVSVALIKPRRGLLDGEYLTWALRTPGQQTRIVQRSRGDMIRHLVLREIRDLQLPLLPLPEQRRIVAELDALQTKTDEVKRLQTESAKELDALLPAILDRAFRGDL